MFKDNIYKKKGVNKCLLTESQIPMQGKLLKCTETMSQLYNIWLSRYAI